MRGHEPSWLRLGGLHGANLPQREACIADRAEERLAGRLFGPDHFDRHDAVLHVDFGVRDASDLRELKIDVRNALGATHAEDNKRVFAWRERGGGVYGAERNRVGRPGVCGVWGGSAARKHERCGDEREAQCSRDVARISREEKRGVSSVLPRGDLLHGIPLQKCLQIDNKKRTLLRRLRVQSRDFCKDRSARRRECSSRVGFQYDAHTRVRF